MDITVPYSLMSLSYEMSLILDSKATVASPIPSFLLASTCEDMKQCLFCFNNEFTDLIIN